MVGTISNSRCPVCRDSGLELVKITGVGFEEITELSQYISLEKITLAQELYGKMDAQEFAIPCRMCNGAMVKRSKKIKERANVPSMYADSKLSDFNWDVYGADSNEVGMQRKINSVNALVEGYKDRKDDLRGLYIYSNVKGTGKTFLASCIVNEMITRYSIIAKFVSASDLIDDARISKKSMSEGGEDRIKVYKECELLVIDDLGVNKSGDDWLSDILFSIIDYRYQHHKLTVVTSNFNIDELPLDSRISDRLYEMTMTIGLPNVSVRSAEAKRKKVDFYKEMGVI